MISNSLQVVSPLPFIAVYLEIYYYKLNHKTKSAFQKWGYFYCSMYTLGKDEQHCHNHYFVYMLLSFPSHIG